MIDMSSVSNSKSTVSKFRVFTSIALTALAVAAGATLPGAAAAEPGDPSISFGSSSGPLTGPSIGIGQRFWLVNQSVYQAKLVGTAASSEDLDSGPPIGTIVQPGEGISFAVTQYFFESNRYVPIFVANSLPGENPDTSADRGARFIPNFLNNAAGQSYQTTCSTDHPERSACVGKGNTAFFTDNPGLTVDLGPADSQRIAAVLQKVCTDNSFAVCEFKATSQQSIMSDKHPTGYGLVNNTDTITVPTTINVEDTQTSSDSLGVAGKISAKLGSIINVEISGTYNHTWTSSHKFSQQVGPIQVPPHQAVGVSAAHPFYRVHGDFTIHLEKSTYKLRDVTFDTPNPDGQSLYIVDPLPMPPGQLAAYPAGVTQIHPGQ
jgi:hypothetical protein